MIVELTKSQCENLAEFIELNLFRVIRLDDEIDNISWLEDMITAKKELEQAVKMCDDREGISEKS